MKILYLPLEFNHFYSAKKFSYPLGVGMVEGFKDIEHVTIPAIRIYRGLKSEYIGNITEGRFI